MMNYLHFYLPAIILTPPVAVVLLFGVGDSVRARWNFDFFFFQVKYRLSYCLPQQMSEVKRRIFIYLQLTYD
jgi:hypothetical protein